MIQIVIKLRVDAPGSWYSAKCGELEITKDFDPFFEGDEIEATKFCNGIVGGDACPIKNSCLLFSLTNNERVGVWGGKTELQRRYMRKTYKLKGKEPRPEWLTMYVPDDDEILRLWGKSKEEILAEDEEELEDDD